MSTNTQTAYDIEFIDGIFGSGAKRLGDLLTVNGARRCLVFMDSGAAHHYGGDAAQALRAYGIEAKICCFKTSEREKSLETVTSVIKAIDEFRLLRRSEPILCIGGGILLDVVGLAASLYRRGTPYLRVPTTLLAIVDAGIGAKTGVSFGSGKNRVGAYYAPMAVAIDVGLLRTLPGRHLRSGMAEIVKMALIKDVELFLRLEIDGAAGIDAALQRDADRQIVWSAISSMVEELAPNLFEDNLARVVDFGHTFSQGIEMADSRRYLHGEAVALDMALSIGIARGRGLLSSADATRALDLFDALGLPTVDESLATQVLLASLDEAVRHRDGSQNVPLPTAVGNYGFVADITSDEVHAAQELLGRRARNRTGVRVRP